MSARERVRQNVAKTDASHATVEAILVLMLLTLGTLLLGVFLGYLVLSRERARRRSERTVEVLRQSLLPTSLPAIPGCDLAVRFHPAQAAELVGGDFYDVFAVSDGRWAIIVGDVCGKGAEAAAVTAMARWTLRSLASWSVGPDEALRFLNRAMLGEDLEGRFVTVAYLLLTLAERDRPGLAGLRRTSTADPRAGRGRPARPPLARHAVGDLARHQAPDHRAGAGARRHDPALHRRRLRPRSRSRAPARRGAPRPRPRGRCRQLADTLQRYATEPDEAQRDDIAIVAVQFTERRRGGGPGREGTGPRAVALSSPSLL